MVKTPLFVFVVYGIVLHRPAARLVVNSSWKSFRKAGHVTTAFVPLCPTGSRRVTGEREARSFVLKAPGAKVNTATSSIQPSKNSPPNKGGELPMAHKPAGALGVTVLVP